MACEVSNAEKETSHAYKLTECYLSTSSSKKHQSEEVKLDRQTLVDLIRDRDTRTLQKLGGVKELVNLLGSSLEGIKDDNLQELDENRELNGSNHHPRKPCRSIFLCFMDEWKNVHLILLMLCALIFSILGTKPPTDWHDGVSIIVALTTSVLIKSIVIYKQKCDFLVIDERTRSITQIEVSRRGKRRQLPISDLLVGDIVFLKIGDRVPADGLLLDGHSLYMDRSALTGEEESIPINSRQPFLLCGSIVNGGHGRMVVTGVGMSTQWCQLMARNYAQGGNTVEETPLQVRVKAGFCVRRAGLSMAIIVFLASVIFRLADDSWKFKLGQAFFVDTLTRLAESMGVSVVLMVVAVAEGLPQAVSFSLNMTIKRMMADNIFVKRPAACEIMGSVTCICTEKTGSLTVFDGMVVHKMWVAGEMRDSTSSSQGIPKCVRDLLLEGIAQNSTGSIDYPEGSEEPDVTGSPIEKATLHWGLQLGLNYAQARAQSSILQLKAFTPIQKKAGVALRVADSGKVRVHWKGAAEVILASSDRILCADNSIMRMSSPDKDSLQSVIEGMAAESLCCIAFSYMQIDDKEIPSTSNKLKGWKIPQEASTLLAIIGIKNTCRPEVPEAVQQCRAADIKVIMLTGDNLRTATAIATECGILKNGELAIEGSIFRHYTDEIRKEKCSEIGVIARSSPLDRFLFVKTLRELRGVVAVTGVAMGAKGTEVTKERSDIIIMEGGFASVVRSVQWGQSHYLAVQKYLQYQLTARLTVIVVNAVTTLCTGETSLTIVQLLWINLLIDTLGALALAREPRCEGVLNRAPINAEEPLISNVMWRNILSQCFYQVVVLLELQFRGTQLLKIDGPGADEVKQTIMFTALVFCQLVGLVNARKIEEMTVLQGILKNHVLLGVAVATLILQVVLVEYLNIFASTVKISWKFWLISIAIGGFCWPVDCLAKLIPVPKRLTLAGHRRRIRNCRQRREENNSLLVVDYCHT